MKRIWEIDRLETLLGHAVESFRLRGSTSCFARYVAFSGGSCFSKPRSISYVLLEKPKRAAKQIESNGFFVALRPMRGTYAEKYDLGATVVRASTCEN